MPANGGDASFDNAVFTINALAVSTSAKTFYYGLPGSEGFTVGAGGSSVSVVELELSGSGTVTVSISTGTFGTGTVEASGIVTVSGTGWYAFTFAPVSLAAGTYYVNVVAATGTVQWGYTTAPSVSPVNATVMWFKAGGTPFSISAQWWSFAVANDPGYSSALEMATSGSLVLMPMATTTGGVAFVIYNTVSGIYTNVGTVPRALVFVTVAFDGFFFRGL